MNHVISTFLLLLRVVEENVADMTYLNISDALDKDL